jgi:DNA-binding HxlR family transcriptional regulator
MRTKSFSDMTCSVAGALEAIGDRWGFLVLRDLTLGLSRYDQLRSSTGVPAQTLADRLKHLETTRLIARRRYQEHPPRDEYTLTPKGRDLATVLTALREWGDRWEAHGAAGPPLEIYDRVTGHPLELALVDTQSGAPIARGRAEVRAGPGADALVQFRLSAGQARSRANRSNEGKPSWPKPT